MSIYFQKSLRFSRSLRIPLGMFSESAYFSSTAMVLALVAFWAFEGQGKDNVSKRFIWQLFTTDKM